MHGPFLPRRVLRHASLQGEAADQDAQGAPRSGEQENRLGEGKGCISCKFIRIQKDKNPQQSMFRRCNCKDNAPQESFFGHMKDEIDLSACNSFIDVIILIDAWIDYYNAKRYV